MIKIDVMGNIPDILFYMVLIDLNVESFALSEKISSRDCSRSEKQWS